MSAATRKIELTEAQIEILTVIVNKQLEFDLGELLLATEEQDQHRMCVLMIVSNEERKILKSLSA